MFEFIAFFLYWTFALPTTAHNCTQYFMAEKYRKSACFARGSQRCSEGAPLRGKMGQGVVEYSEHLTGDQKGFHTSCVQLFRSSQN